MPEQIQLVCKRCGKAEREALPKDARQRFRVYYPKARDFAEYVNAVKKHALCDACQERVYGL